MNDRDNWTVDAMEKWGGSFVKQLASLARQADMNNLQKIKIAFSDYWEEYEEMGQKLETDEG